MIHVHFNALMAKEMVNHWPRSPLTQPPARTDPPGDDVEASVLAPLVWLAAGRWICSPARGDLEHAGQGVPFGHGADPLSGGKLAKAEEKPRSPRRLGL